MLANAPSTRTSLVLIEAVRVSNIFSVRLFCRTQPDIGVYSVHSFLTRHQTCQAQRGPGGGGAGDRR